jgi:SulP family sulfate permease
VLFGEELFFANAGIFRREMHVALAKFPETQHVIIDAVAMADIDYTGMNALSQVVADLEKDKITIAFARASETVRDRLKKSTNTAIHSIALFDSTDAAAVAAEATPKG